MRPGIVMAWSWRHCVRTMLHAPGFTPAVLLLAMHLAMHTQVSRYVTIQCSAVQRLRIISVGPGFQPMSLAVPVQLKLPCLGLAHIVIACIDKHSQLRQKDRLSRVCNS